MSQSAGRNPLLLAGFVVFFTLLLAAAAWGLNRIVNPPPPATATAPCQAPSGHPVGNANHTYTTAPAVNLNATKSYTAAMCTTRGLIKITLRAQDAPQTVNDFVFLADSGYYDGLTFHRVCPSASDTTCGPVTGGIHIAQGGDPKGDGTGRNPGFVIPDETPVGTYTAGTIALARPSNADGSKLPNSSGGQFFIDTAENKFPPDYNLFGDVTSGQSAANRLVKGDTIFWVAIETGPLPSGSPATSGASPSAAPSTPAPSPSPS